MAVLVRVPGLLAGPPAIDGRDVVTVDPFAEATPEWDALAGVLARHPGVFVAVSLGTAVAVRAAVRHPDAVAALVLLRPAVGFEARTDLADLAAAARRRGVAGVWRRLSLPGPPPDLGEGDLAVLEALGRLPLLTGPDDLAAVRQPTLLVATAGDALHPMAIATAYWRHIPTTRLVNEVPGDPPLDLRALVDRFLAEVL